MIAALLRKRTWLRVADLIAWYKHLREQRRLRPVDLVAELDEELTCTHGTPVSTWQKCLACCGIGGVR